MVKKRIRDQIRSNISSGVVIGRKDESLGVIAFALDASVLVSVLFRDISFQ
jgi:hypothetical protein